MAMYPNATKGYMPFVKPAHKRQAAKRSKADKEAKTRSNDGTKTYKVTMRDRRGFTYTYIIQADASKNLPVLCESRVSAPVCAGASPSSASSSSSSSSASSSSTTATPSPLLCSSLPNMRRSVSFPISVPETRSCASLADGKEDLTKVGDGEKKGLFNSLLQFIKKKTSSRASASKTVSAVAKPKRKVKPLSQMHRKRQRTVSALSSNLDPIQESPDEDHVEDTDSYTQGSTTLTSSESESGEGHLSCP